MCWLKNNLWIVIVFVFWWWFYLTITRIPNVWSYGSWVVYLQNAVTYYAFNFYKCWILWVAVSFTDHKFFTVINSFVDLLSSVLLFLSVVVASVAPEPSSVEWWSLLSWQTDESLVSTTCEFSYGTPGRSLLQLQLELLLTAEAAVSVDGECGWTKNDVCRQCLVELAHPDFNVTVLVTDYCTLGKSGFCHCLFSA